ncbi:MAG: phosphoglycerate mutase family protein [Candidatus ainarchaeum sp.]|nr:phosphoglycerate mutase family protein [Candidatus ainarchaeum sp.]
MRVYLIRHGQTTSDVEEKYNGWYDDHLTNKGKLQASELAKKLSEKLIEKVFVSPRIRTIETALIIAKELPVKFDVVNEFGERNSYGVLTGLTKKEALEKFPDEVEELEANKPYQKVKDCEDYYDFAQKVISKFNEMIENEFFMETQGLAIITHGATISTIFREVLGFEINGIKDCAIFELEFDGDGYEILYAKDVLEMIADN